jgi:hypothetical protein
MVLNTAARQLDEMGPTDDPDAVMEINVLLHGPITQTLVISWCIAAELYLHAHSNKAAGIVQKPGGCSHAARMERRRVCRNAFVRTLLQELSSGVCFFAKFYFVLYLS